MLWSIDKCQNKRSTDGYHVTISRAQLKSASRSRDFRPSVAFRFDRGLMSGQFVVNRAWLFGNWLTLTQDYKS